MTIEHEKLEVYRLGLQAIRDLESVAMEIPPSRLNLRDQLRRASASILLNLAEGVSEFAPREKQRFYRMSRRSAAECIAIIDIIAVTGQASLHAGTCKELLERVMAMMTGMIKAQDTRLSRP